MFIYTTDENIKTDQSATPIYRLHITESNKVYSIEGTPEAAKRIFSIITAYQSCGRSGEAETATLENSCYDYLTHKIFTKIVQRKTSKLKVSRFSHQGNTYSII